RHILLASGYRRLPSIYSSPARRQFDTRFSSSGPEPPSYAELLEASRLVEVRIEAKVSARKSETPCGRKASSVLLFSRRWICGIWGDGDRPIPAPAGSQCCKPTACPGTGEVRTNHYSMKTCSELPSGTLTSEASVTAHRLASRRCVAATVRSPRRTL